MDFNFNEMLWQDPPFAFSTEVVLCTVGRELMVPWPCGGPPWVDFGEGCV